MAEENAGLGEMPEGGSGEQAPKTFTQQEVDELIRKRVARVKHEPPADYAELKAKLAEYERASGESEDELGKLRDRIGKLEGENEAMRHAAEVSEWKAEASRETGVPASILRGETREDIEAHAAAVREAVKSMGAAYPAVDPGRPAPAEMTKAQILAIEDPEERKAAIAANIDKF